MMLGEWLNMNTTTNRKVGIDLLRILSMLGIIGLHVIGIGGIINNLTINSFRYYFILFIYVICFLSVDIFGILSGFLSWNKSKIKYSRIIELLSIGFFYSIIITFVFYYFNLYNIRSMGISIIIHSLFPALIGRNWYLTCYTFVFFLMPYLNDFIKNISKNKFKNMLIVLFILLCILPNLFFNTDFFCVMNGYSPFWLMYCYLLGAYIGKYHDKDKVTKKMILTFVGCIIIAFILNCLVRIITMSLFHELKYPFWFINYISPFIVIGSILLVKFFSQLHLTITNKFLKQFIYYLSFCSFSVYIIHANYLIYDFVINGFMIKYINQSILVFLLAFFISIPLIYLICFMIDLIRIYIFKLFRINQLIDYLGNKLNQLLDSD